MVLEWKDQINKVLPPVNIISIKPHFESTLLASVNHIIITMLATCASSLARASARVGGRQSAASAVLARRTMVTAKLGDRDASHAWNKSCYSGIDFTIGDESTVLEGEE